MTFENSKRLYEHFLSIGNNEAAKELLNKHPSLDEKEQEKPKAQKAKK